MSDNKKKFKNFLANGFQARSEEPEPEEEEISYDELDIEDEISETSYADTEELQETLSALWAQVEELQQTVRELRENPPFPDMSSFVTTREQIKSLTNAIDRQNIEITNKTLTKSLEQIAVMREDFFKLCAGMRDKIEVMSAKDVLSSFEAYQVDMENILTDGGVFIGHFPYDSLNTIHQRIVDVVPTDDPNKNGMIAERLSEGYKLGDKVILKEKVTVFKYIDDGEKQTSKDEEPAKAEEASEETISETASETVSEEKESENTDKTEEEE
jgi:molecular chaperone GrpE (heat shock protein)